MTTEPWTPEPSPFSDDDDGPTSPRSKPWEPSVPMSGKQLDYWMSQPIEGRTFDAYSCMWNLMAEDGIGHRTGTWVQCTTRIADPTRSRYCLEHAQKLGVEFYSPAEFSEATAKETSQNLTRLVPKAVKTLETVMADSDAPPGIRAKAADSVLDRTGYAKGVDVRVDAQVAVVDITGIIKERLDALREAAAARADGSDGAGPGTGGAEGAEDGVVAGSVVSDETPELGSAPAPVPAPGLVDDVVHDIILVDPVEPPDPGAVTGTGDTLAGNDDGTGSPDDGLPV